MSTYSFTIATAVALLLCSQRLFSQDLVIEYDHETKKVTYYNAGGTPVSDGDAYVGHNDRVIVRVKNLNQNVYTVNATASSQRIQVPNSSVDLPDVINKA